MICFAHVYKSHKYVQYVNIYNIFNHTSSYIYTIIYVYNVEYMTTSGQISHILL